MDDVGADRSAVLDVAGPFAELGGLEDVKLVEPRADLDPLDLLG